MKCSVPPPNPKNTFRRERWNVAVYDCPYGQLQLGICRILLLLAMSLLWLGILGFFFRTFLVAWWLQMFVLLGIFWLDSVSSISGKMKMFWTKFRSVPQILCTLLEFLVCTNPQPFRLGRKFCVMGKILLLVRIISSVLACEQAVNRGMAGLAIQCLFQQ